MYGISAELLNLSLCLWRAARGEKRGSGGVPFVASYLCLLMAFSVEGTWIPGPPLLKLIHKLIHQSYLKAAACQDAAYADCLRAAAGVQIA